MYTFDGRQHPRSQEDHAVNPSADFIFCVSGAIIVDGEFRPHSHSRY